MIVKYARPEIISIKINGNNSVTADVFLPKQNSAILIVAIYNGRKLMNIKAKAVAQSGDVVLDIATTDDIKTIKVMLWEGYGFSSIQPLCKAEVFIKDSNNNWIKAN